MDRKIGHRKNIKGLCRFYACYCCNFTVCKQFILPQKIFDDKCPKCESIYWYKGPPVFKELKNCNCYVLSCDYCGQILCSCNIESLNGYCLECNAKDKWVIIPQNFFLVNTNTKSVNLR